MIDTERLHLRPFRAEDLPGFVAYRRASEVARFQSWDTTYSMTDAERFLASQRDIVFGRPGEWMQLAAVDLLGVDALAWDVDGDVPDDSDEYYESLPFEVSGMLRSRANTIEGGTTEINKNVLGERVLGLPRRHRSGERVDAHGRARAGLRREEEVLDGHRPPGHSSVRGEADPGGPRVGAGSALAVGPVGAAGGGGGGACCAGGVVHRLAAVPGRVGGGAAGGVGVRGSALGRANAARSGRASG